MTDRFQGERNPIAPNPGARLTRLHKSPGQNGFHLCRNRLLWLGLGNSRVGRFEVTMENVGIEVRSVWPADGARLRVNSDLGE